MPSGTEGHREVLRLTMLVPPYAAFLPLLKDVPGDIGDAARQWLITGVPPLQYDQFGDPLGLADLYPNAG